MVSIAPSARRAKFNHYGPWVLGISALIVAIIGEGIRHHLFHRVELIYFVILIPTIIVHEVSHGVVANWCGDDTARRAGRLSLNPIRHVDPIGTVLLPLLLIFTTGQAFGWAKPVPVATNRLRHPRNQAVLVGLAGPAVNVVIAFIAGVAFHLLTKGVFLAANPDQWPLGYEVIFYLGYVNVIIAAFNLIPIPPLDGSAVLERLLPDSLLPGYYRIRQFSMVIVLFFVFLAPGALDVVFNHALSIWSHLL